MMVFTSVKKLSPDYAVSATFEHQGVQYEERFNKIGTFKVKLRKTKDAFICAVDYTCMKVIHPIDVRDYV